jgi:hypothetical protein
MNETQASIIVFCVVFFTGTWFLWMTFAIFPFLQRLESLLVNILVELKKRSK